MQAKEHHALRAVKDKTTLFSRKISSARLKYEIAPLAITETQYSVIQARTSVSSSLWMYQRKAYLAFQRNRTFIMYDET